jgi:hypothetical protein
METVSWLHLAKQDYRAAEKLYYSELYAASAQYYSQAMAKFFKHHLKLYGEAARDEEIMESLDPYGLWERAMGTSITLSLTIEDEMILRSLWHWYYINNYMTPDYREIYKHDVQSVLQTVGKVNLFFNKHYDDNGFLQEARAFTS